jgi:hypothetical protein
MITLICITQVLWNCYGGMTAAEPIDEIYHLCWCIFWSILWAIDILYKNNRMLKELKKQ